jgi:hypothetical protein
VERDGYLVLALALVKEAGGKSRWLRTKFERPNEHQAGVSGHQGLLGEGRLHSLAVGAQKAERAEKPLV